MIFAILLLNERVIYFTGPGKFSNKPRARFKLVPTKRGPSSVDVALIKSAIEITVVYWSNLHSALCMLYDCINVIY